jgi:hypothetical protein
MCFTKPDNEISDNMRCKQILQSKQVATATATTKALQRHITCRLSLNDIAPEWSKRLEEQKEHKKLPFPLSFTWLRWHHEIKHSSKCIVGEAYGFSSSYTSTCKECDRFSVKFLYSFVIHSYPKIQENKDLFVEHWNECHHDISNNASFAMKKHDYRFYGE